MQIQKWFFQFFFHIFVFRHYKCQVIQDWQSKLDWRVIVQEIKKWKCDLLLRIGDFCLSLTHFSRLFFTLKGEDQKSQEKTKSKTISYYSETS